MMSDGPKSGLGLFVPVLLLGVLFLQDGVVAQSPPPPPPTYPTQNYLKLMKNDIITNSDIWDEELILFTANLAVTGKKPCFKFFNRSSSSCV